MKTASLPMHDMPETRATVDGLWSGIAHWFERERVPDVPRRLTHNEPVSSLWSDPDLLFSQCCGYDLVSGKYPWLRALATPVYRADGCQGCRYSSCVVVAAGCTASALEHLRGSVSVINGRESHSGMSALRALIAPLSSDGRFFSDVKVSGAHRESLAMVAQGEADVAAIDCVTLALLARHAPAALAGTRTLCRTASALVPPFVSRAELGRPVIRRMQVALLRAFQDPGLAAECKALLLAGIRILPDFSYDEIRSFERTAFSCGYRELA